MSTAHHTPYATNAPLTHVVLEAPLSQLDQALVNEEAARAAADTTEAANRGAAVTAEATSRISGDAALSAAISAVALAGSGATTTINGAGAASGQKVVPVASTTGFTVGSAAFLENASAQVETGTVASIIAGVSITLAANLAHTYAAGSTVSLSPAELVLSRAAFATLSDRLTTGWLPSVTIRASGGDDLAAFQAAIAAANSAWGVRIYCPDNLYLLSAELKVNKGNIWLIGNGPSQGLASFLRRTGSVTVGDGVVRFGGDNGLATFATWPVKGGGISGFTLDAASKCDFALNVKSCNTVRFERLFGMGAVLAQLELNPTQDNSGPYNNITSCDFIQVALYNPGAAYGMRCGNLASGIGGIYTLKFDTFSSGSNATHPAVYLGNCDDLYFYNYAFGATGTPGAGDGTGVEFGSGVGQVHFMGGYAVVGTSPFVARAAGPNPATEITLIPLSNEDQGKRPIIEPGATLYYIGGDGYHTFRPDPKTFHEMHDDFHGDLLANAQVGNLGWHTQDGNSGAYMASEANHPGIREFVTTGSGTLAGIYMVADATKGVVLPSEGFDDTFIFRIPATAATLANTQIRVGLMMAPTGDPGGDGIYIQKLYGNVNWVLVCRAGGVETVSAALAGGAVAYDTWYHARIRRFGPTEVAIRMSHLYPYVDINQTMIMTSLGSYTVPSGLPVTLNSHIPTATLSPFFQVKENAGAAARVKLHVDFFQHSIIGLDR